MVVEMSPILDDMYFELGISPYLCDDFGEEASSTGEAALSELMMHDRRRRLVELLHSLASFHGTAFGWMT
jgi:hypothetical protein